MCAEANKLIRRVGVLLIQSVDALKSPDRRKKKFKSSISKSNTLVANGLMGDSGQHAIFLTTHIIPDFPQHCDRILFIVH